MTVSGSGRTREKDTRAPARGPFCVWGSSLAGEEGVLLQAACSPSGSCLSVWMPAARRICGKTGEISPPLSVPPHGRATARACILCADRGSWALHGNAACATHMPVLTDRPYSFLTYAAGVPAPLSFLVLTPEAASRSIEQDSLEEYLSSSCLSVFCMSAF